MTMASSASQSIFLEKRSSKAIGSSGPTTQSAGSLEGEHRYRTLFHAMPTSFLELDITGVRPILARFRDYGVAEIRARV